MAAANPRVSGIKRKGMGGAAGASSASAFNTANAVTSSQSHQHSILPEDSGIIRCVCTIEADDGFTIQCERCYAWLHGSCVGFTPEEEERGALPEVYICPLCENGGKVDPAWRARATKAQRMRLALAASASASAASAGAVSVDSEGGYPGSSSSMKMLLAEDGPIEGYHQRASTSSAFTRLENIDPTGTLVIPLPGAHSHSQGRSSRRTSGKGSNTTSTSRAPTGRISLSPGTATALVTAGNLPGLATWSTSAGHGGSLSTVTSHGPNQAAFLPQEQYKNYNSTDPSIYHAQPIQPQQQQQRGKRQSSASSAKGRSQGQGSKPKSPFQQYPLAYSQQTQTQNATGTGIEAEYGGVPYSATTQTASVPLQGTGAGGDREKESSLAALLHATNDAYEPSPLSHANPANGAGDAEQFTIREGDPIPKLEDTLVHDRPAGDGDGSYAGVDQDAIDEEALKQQTEHAHLDELPSAAGGPVAALSSLSASGSAAENRPYSQPLSASSYTARPPRAGTGTHATAAGQRGPAPSTSTVSALPAPKQRRKSAAAGNALSAIGIHPTPPPIAAGSGHVSVSASGLGGTGSSGAGDPQAGVWSAALGGKSEYNLDGRLGNGRTADASGAGAGAGKQQPSSNGIGNAPVNRSSRTRTQQQAQAQAQQQVSGPSISGTTAAIPSVLADPAVLGAGASVDPLAAAAATAGRDEQDASLRAQSTDSEDFLEDDDDDLYNNGLGGRSGKKRKDRYEPWQFEYTPVEKLRWSDKGLEEECRELMRKYLEEDVENLHVGVGGSADPAQAMDMDGGNEAMEGAPEGNKRVATGTVLGSNAFSAATAKVGDSLLSVNSGALNAVARLRTVSPAPTSSGSSTPTLHGHAHSTASHSRVAAALSSPLLPVILTSPLSPSQIEQLSSSTSLYIKPLASTSLSLAPPTCTPFSAPSCPISLMNPYPRPTIHAAFSQSSHPAGSLISLMNGEVLSGDEYRNNPMNQWKQVGAAKNFTRMLGKPWDLVLDQRRWGDESRFVRQGCHPNVYVRPVILRRAASMSASAGQQQDKGKRATAAATAAKKRKLANKAAAAAAAAEEAENADSYELAFGLYAIHDISKREELILPMDWADDHVIHALHTLLFNPELVFPSIPADSLFLLPNRGGGGGEVSEDDDGVPSTSSFPSLSSLQKSQLETCTKHLYSLSRLASSTCVTLLGHSPCSCEKRRDCSIAWLWKLGGFTETSSKHRGARIKIEDFDLHSLKLACGMALPAAPASENHGRSAAGGRGKNGASKRRANLGPLVGLPRGWRMNAGSDEQGEQATVSAIPPPVVLDPEPKALDLAQDVQMQTEQEEEEVALKDDEAEDNTMEVDQEPSLPPIVESLVQASKPSETLPVAAPPPPPESDSSDAESDLTEPLPSGGEEVLPPASAAVAVIAKKPGRKPAATATASASKKQSATAGKGQKATTAQAERPRLKKAKGSGGGSARARKVIRDDSSDEDEQEKEKKTLEQTATTTDKGKKGREDEDPASGVSSGEEEQQAEKTAKSRSSKEPKAFNGNKARRPTLQRKDSKQKSQTSAGSSSSTIPKEQEKEKEKAETTVEKFKAKTKSGSMSTKDKDKDKEKDGPSVRPKSSGGLPAFRKKSTVDEERAKQLKLQREAPSPPVPAPTGDQQQQQQAARGPATNAAEDAGKTAPRNAEGPDLASLFDVEMPPVVAALAVEATQDQREQLVPTSDESESTAQTAAGASAQADDAMQLDPPPDPVHPSPATQPVVVEAILDAEVSKQHGPQEPAAPMPAPEPAAPPRRVSFMAYKQRVSTGTAAMPKASPSSSSVEVSVIPEEGVEAASASAPGNTTNLPAEQAAPPAPLAESAKVPVVQEMQIDIPATTTAYNGNVLDKALVQTPMVEKPESGLSVQSTPSAVADEPSPAPKKEAEVFVAPTAVVPPTAPPPPMPRARLSFAAYRQRLSTTPASPSEASAASSTTTPAATPAGGAQDEEKKLEIAVTPANDKSPLPQAKTQEKNVRKENKADSPAKTEKGTPEAAATTTEKAAPVNVELPEVLAPKKLVESTSVEIQDTPTETTPIPNDLKPPARSERKPAASIDAVREEGEVTMDTSVEAGEVSDAPAPTISREQNATCKMTIDDKPEQTRPNERRHSATPPPREAVRSSPVETASTKVETEARALPADSKASRAEAPAPIEQVSSQPSTRPSRWSNAISPASSYASLPSSHQAVQRDSLPPLSPPSGPRNLPTGPRSGSAAPPSAAAAVAPIRGRAAGRGAYHGRNVPSGGPSPPSRDAYNDGKSSYRQSGGPSVPPVGPRVDRDPPSAPRAFQQGPPSGRGRGNYAGAGSRFDGVPSGPASMLPRDRGWGPRGGSGGGRGGYRGGRGGPRTAACQD